MISAYQRIPLYITGDGKLSIQKLIDYKQAQLIRNGRDTIINLKEERMKNKLQESNLLFHDILEKIKGYI